jgi:hypothetical protein
MDIARENPSFTGLLSSNNSEAFIQFSTSDMCLPDNSTEDRGDKNLETNTSHTNNEIEEEKSPELGIKFDNVDELFSYYKRYAARKGFSVRKRNSKKGPNEKLRKVTFTCGREGGRASETTNPLKSQPTMQIGCMSRINAASEVKVVWRITKIILEHNHETSPTKSRTFKCNREVEEHVKRQLELNDIAGIPLHKSYNSIVVESGGYENMSFNEKDCRNFIDEARRLRLGEGDATAIQAYFIKTQAKCPSFFFSLDLNDMNQLRNVFWADNRSREAYKEFGDVVTFDTTYLTNKYDMPFAPFVGVNHHGQSTLLGCGLVSNEDTYTFVWLFNTWLQCMEGQAPQGIITDQDRAMKNAIEIVFPNTTHRWCLWHILKKLPKKFGGRHDKQAIMTAISNAVYDTQTPEEFEDNWARLIEVFTLDGNEWLSGLYDERRRWVPCYLKTQFWAEPKTTDPSRQSYLPSRTLNFERDWLWFRCMGGYVFIDQ